MRKCVRACQLVLLSLVMALPGNAQQLTPEQPLQQLTQAVVRLNEATNPADVSAALEELVTAHRRMMDWGAIDAASVEHFLDTLAQLLSTRADSFEQASQWKEAESCLEQLIQMQNDRYGNDAWQTKDARRRVSDLKQRQALPANQQTQLHAAILQLAEASRLYESGEFADALTKCENATEILGHVLGKEHPHYSHSLNLLAGLSKAMGDHLRAEHLYLEANAIEKKVLGNEHPNYATGLNNLAVLYLSMEFYARAEPLLLEATAIDEKLLGKEHPSYAVGLSNLGALYTEIGDYVRAEQLLHDSMAIKERVIGKEHPEYAQSLSNLAGLYLRMGDTSRAEPMFLEAHAIWEDVFGKEHPRYAASLSNLGALYLLLGDQTRAELHFSEAMAVNGKLLGKQHPAYASNLNSLAVMYLERRDYARAEPLLLEALTILRDLFGEDHSYYASSLSNVAGLYAVMADHARAEPLLAKALAIREKILGKEHPEYAENLRDLAGLYQSAGDPARAEPLLVEFLQRSTQFVSKTIRSQSQAAALELLRSDNFAGADALLSVRRQLPDSDQAETYRLSWQSRGLLSALLSERQRVRGDSPEAAELYETLSGVSRQLAQLTLASVPAEQQELRRQRLGELNEQKETLERQLATVSESFRRGEEIAQSTPVDLMRLVPDDVAVVDLIETSVWNHSPSGTGKLESIREYDAFVLRKRDGSHTVQWLHLGPAEEINLAIGDWLALIDQDRGEAASPSHPAMILRQRLWEPLEAHLSGAKHVVVVPGSATAFIPWSALPGKQPGTFLLEDYTISTALSGQELYRQLTDPESDKQSLMLVGGVDYQSRRKSETPTSVPTSTPDDHSAPVLLANRSGMVVPETRVDWPYLDGTMNEAEAIQSLWHSNPAASFLQGAEANEDAVQSAMSEARYLHLATHGFFADGKFRSMLQHDPKSEQLFGSLRAPGGDGLSSGRSTVSGRNPLILCGVVLAGANLPVEKDEHGLPTGADGILTAQEVLHTDLRGTELVALSACDTGRGTQVAGGEGIYGLQRAFHLAGARHVVASLWKVDDQATAALMKLFYRNLWHEKQQPAEALRNAQLTLLNHPGQIEALATSRGPNFDKTVQVTQGKPAVETRTDNTSSRAPIRLWAAFTHSGPPIAPVSR